MKTMKTMNIKRAVPKAASKGVPGGAFPLLGLCFLTLASCASLGFTGTRGWSLGKSLGKAGEKAPRVRIIRVEAERAGGWIALEEELGALLPLVLLEQGCLVVPPGEEADYAAAVQAREREYTLGWTTRRSLALELRFWAGQGEEPALYNTVPLAAAQVLAGGNRSFSSSRDLNRMLREAVKRALRGLPGPQKKEAS
jgi:hypothetical protein